MENSVKSPDVTEGILVMGYGVFPIMFRSSNDYMIFQQVHNNAICKKVWIIERVL